MSIGPSTSELCALCFEQKIEPEDLACGHSFCRTCLDDLRSYRRQQWARCCPLCRQPIGSPLLSDNDDNGDNGSITSVEQWQSSDEYSIQEYWSYDDYELVIENYYYYSDTDTSTEDGQNTETNQDNEEA